MANGRSPTMKDVAKTAGVAVSTVSHVVNRSRFVSEEATERVEQAIRQLGFRANRVAQNLRSGRSNLIGFVVSNLYNYFYVRIARGIESVIGKYGYHLTLIDSQERTDLEQENIESLIDRGVDGLILVPTCTTCDHIGKLLSADDRPIVFVDREAIGFQADSVLLSNEEGAYRATKHLIEKGHVDIGFVAFHFGHDEIDMTMQERIEGYRKAHQEAGLPIRKNYIEITAGGSVLVNELRHAESYRMMERLLTTPVSAVLCGNSPASIGVFMCLKDRKVKIPEEIAMITFDDDLWLTMATPSISAVAQPAELLGAAAAERLMQRIQGKPQPYGCIRLKADLIIRDSS
ncbi:MAG: LacI family transcriptional regulator [Spirochaetaceae bacterium]|nr:MAG: LacI family transcriptional regulator [Spirochaetaceae bacterium]